MEREDPWLAPDKVYHVLFCFSLTILFSTVATFTRYPFLRRHAIRIGSICSLLAGAAKEAADELGYFRSAGASAKDAVADVIVCWGKKANISSWLILSWPILSISMGSTEYLKDF